MKDTIQTIRRASNLFFSGTLLSRISGMLRDMSMAYAFGTQPSIAAFMIAFRFAHLLRRLFGEGALQSAFIPEFEALRHQQEYRAFTFFRDLTLILTLLLIFIIGISSSVLASFLWWGYLSPANNEIIYLTLLMLPSLFFICLYGLNASLLQCEKIYFIPSVAPVAFNGVWIASVFYLRNTSSERAMPYLALGVVFACFCQWLLTVPSTWRSVKRSLSSFFFPSFFSPSSDLWLLAKPLSLGILGVAASQVNHAIDSLYARFAEAEGPALLWYAIRIQQLPLALFGVAIAGAVLPPLSRARKTQHWDEYQHFLEDAFFRTWIFIFPVTVTLFLFGDTSVSLLYGRGDFGPESIIQTTHCLWGYGIGLIPSAFVLILAPASYAQKNYKLPALASLLTMLLNVFFNTLFIVGFGWGAVSVAIATSISAWINFFLLTWCLSKTGVSLFSYSLLQKTIPLTLATLGAFIMSYQIRVNLEEPFFSHSLLFSSSFLEKFVVFIYQISIFFGSLLLFFYIICFIQRFLIPLFLLKNIEYKN